MKHKVPNVSFKVRELGEWVTKTSDDFFKGKRVVVFGLPGAFTPTCSSKQLPGYESKYKEFKERGIDEKAFYLFKLIYEKDRRYAYERIEYYDQFDNYLPLIDL